MTVAVATDRSGTTRRPALSADEIIAWCFTGIHAGVRSGGGMTVAEATDLIRRQDNQHRPACVAASSPSRPGDDGPPPDNPTNPSMMPQCW